MSPDVQPGDMVYVTTELSSPYEENVKLLDFVDESIEDVVLRNPKWDTSMDTKDNYFRERSTTLKNYNELLSSNSTLSDIIENEIVSGSFLKSVELDGIEYDNFDKWYNDNKKEYVNLYDSLDVITQIFLEENQNTKEKRKLIWRYKYKELVKNGKSKKAK